VLFNIEAVIRPLSSRSQHVEAKDNATPQKSERHRFNSCVFPASNGIADFGLTEAVIVEIDLRIDVE